MDYGIFVHALLKTPADFVLMRNSLIGARSIYANKRSSSSNRPLSIY